MYRVNFYKEMLSEDTLRLHKMSVDQLNINHKFQISSIGKKRFQRIIYHSQSSFFITFN